MAPFDSTLTAKISPLIEGQVPDFIQADHPTFVQLLQDYYKFLEAGELKLTATINYVAQETISSNYILDEDGEKIVTEKGDGTLGKFEAGEVITGGTSKATATVLVDDITKGGKIYISSQQRFVVGETVTGGTSGSTATVASYRGNPVQNIQQLMDYANPDNTVDAFLDQMLEQFVQSVPKTMATGTSKRNLIKSIRDLYAAKGTSEANKTFLRLLFDEEADIVYPNRFMLRASKAEWVAPTVLRCSAQPGSDGLDVVGQTLTGATSGATAVVESVSIFNQGNDSISEFKLDNTSIIGTFVNEETVTATSNTLDVTFSFTVGSFITKATITNGGLLYSKGDAIEVATDDGGNGFADIEVDEVTTGSVSNIQVDAGGDLYKMGDTISFTSTEVDIDLPTGVVSTVGGNFLLEDTVGNDDYLILDEGTTSSFVEIVCSLDGTDSEGANAGSNILLEGTDATSSDGGDFLVIDEVESTDTYGTEQDRFIVEHATHQGVETGTIKRAVIKKKGSGMSKLPTASISTTRGTGASLISVTEDMGQVISVAIKDGGFNYTTSPKATFKSNLIVEDVTGAFVLGDALTTHAGTIISYDSNLLKTSLNDGVRVEQETAATVNEFIRLENDGGNTPAEKFVLDNVLEAGNIQLENSLNSQTILTEDGYDTIILDNHIIEGLTEEGFLLNEDGSFIQNEDFVFYALLNASDNLETDAGDRLLHEDDVLTADNLLLDRTTGTGNNAGSAIVHETDNPSLIGETIATANGSAKIVKSGFATVTLETGVQAVLDGAFSNTDHFISESNIRLQDSKYYQDFSYEIKVGQDTSQYLNELKGKINPAGFLPFGKVSLATSVAANIQVPAGGATTFSPALASALEAVFAETIQYRLGAVSDYAVGRASNNFITEDGNFNISTDNGLLVTEESAINAPSGLRDVSLVSVKSVKLKLPELFASDTGLELFAGGSYAKMSEFGGIEMEDGTRERGPTTQRERLVLDGVEQEIGQDTVGHIGSYMELEDASNPNINSGPALSDLDISQKYNIVTESGIGDFNLVYESTTPHMFGASITTEDIPFNNVTINDIVISSRLLLADLNTDNREEIVLMEDSQDSFDIILDDTGTKILLEDAVGVQTGGILTAETQGIELENGADIGTIPALNKTETRFPYFTRSAKIHTRTRGRESMQDETSPFEMALDGTDGSSTDAGDNIIQEDFGSNDKLLTERGLFSLHPETPEGGFTILNGTDSSSTDAGGFLEFERGTFESLSGSFPVFVQNQPETFDAATAFFDNTTLTFDRVSGDGS